MRLKNLTPHPVTIVLPNGESTTLPPEGVVPRRETVTEDAGEIDGIPVVRNTLGPVIGLPEPEEGITYIVPFLVASVLPERDDLIAPDTTPASVVRDNQGRIVGVKRLQKA